jgi:hypothetical protein
MIEMTVFETLSPPVQAELIRLYQSERDLKRQVADLERDARRYLDQWRLSLEMIGSTLKTFR